jgi:hypothetical protein
MDPMDRNSNHLWGANPIPHHDPYLSAAESSKLLAGFPSEIERYIIKYEPLALPPTDDYPDWGCLARQPISGQYNDGSQLCELPSTTMSRLISPSYSDISRHSMKSIESIDSGYYSVATQDPIKDIVPPDAWMFAHTNELLNGYNCTQAHDPIAVHQLRVFNGYDGSENEEELQQVDSGYAGSNKPTSAQTGQFPLLRQQDDKSPKRSSKYIRRNDLNDYDKVRRTLVRFHCHQCKRSFSFRASLRRHLLSTSACPAHKSQSRTKGDVDKAVSKTTGPLTSIFEENTTYQGHQGASSAMIALPSTQSLTSSTLHSDFTSHNARTKVVNAGDKRFLAEDPTSTASALDKPLELDDSKENAQLSPRSTETITRETEPTTSSTSRCAAISTTRLNLAQEEQMEQPGYVKKWVDSTCIIQSPPSGYGGEELTSSGFDFRVESENTPARSESEEDRIDTDSESFVLTEYSVNSPDWDPTGAILVPMKLEYIDRLLSSFNLLQRQSQSSVASDMAGSDHSTGSSSDKRRASSPPPGNSSKSHLPKKTRRQSADGDDEEGQGGNDDGSNPQSTPPNIAEDGQGTPLSFACPFVKRYPHRYYKCYSHTLKDVARVKYHLFRDKVHRLPIYCPTCSETFSSEDLRDEHVRALNCTMKPPAKWEGITASQREQLNKRLPSTNSAVENWNAVYQILFPGDTVPASPYIDMSLSGDLRAFREYALSTGPSIWDDILRTRLPENLRSSQGELQSFYRSFYPEALARLFETWNSSRSITRSLQSQSSPSLIRQEPEYLAPPINIAAVAGSSSPSGSDSALGKSVTNGSQSENEPRPASQDKVAQTQQQQQSVMQRDPQSSFVPQQLQTPPTFPHSMPQTPSFTPFGSAEFTGYGYPQNPYEYAHVPGPTPVGQMFNPQYALGTTQPGPAMNRFHYQPPSVDFHQGAFHQPPPTEFPQGAFYPSHQMHIQPQYPYNIHTSHPNAPNPNPMGPGWGPPEAN